MQSPRLHTRSFTNLPLSPSKKDLDAPSNITCIKTLKIQRRLERLRTIGSVANTENIMENLPKLDNIRMASLLSINGLVSPVKRTLKLKPKSKDQSGLLFVSDFWSRKFKTRVLTAVPEAPQRVEDIKITAVSRENINHIRSIRRKMTIEICNTNPSQLLEQFDAEGLNGPSLKINDDSPSLYPGLHSRSGTIPTLRLPSRILKAEGSESDVENKLKTLPSTNRTERYQKVKHAATLNELCPSLAEFMDEKPSTQRSPTEQKISPSIRQKYRFTKKTLDKDMQKEEQTSTTGPRKILSIRRVKNFKEVRL